MARNMASPAAQASAQNSGSQRPVRRPWLKMPVPSRSDSARTAVEQASRSQCRGAQSVRQTSTDASISA